MAELLKLLYNYIRAKMGLSYITFILYNTRISPRILLWLERTRLRIKATAFKRKKHFELSLFCCCRGGFYTTTTTKNVLSGSQTFLELKLIKCGSTK